MAPYLNHLGLVAWPFSVVPRPEHCGFLAGRPQLRADVAALLSGLKRRDTSSIHVLWSWFGAGKTHSLYYLAHQAHILNGQSAGQFLYPVYTEFPRDAHGFSDLFRSLVGSFDTELLTGSVLEAATGQAGSDYYERLTVDSPDLASALRNLAIGSPGERSLAMRWLRGEALPAGEFRKIAISQRISTADQAAHVVKALLAMCSIGMRQKGFQGFRLVWLLDEFQRLARTSSSIVRDINSGLHSLFNSCNCSTGYDAGTHRRASSIRFLRYKAKTDSKIAPCGGRDPFSA